MKLTLTVFCDTSEQARALIDSLENVGVEDFAPAVEVNADAMTEPNAPEKVETAVDITAADVREALRAYMAGDHTSEEAKEKLGAFKPADWPADKPFNVAALDSNDYAALILSLK